MVDDDQLTGGLGRLLEVTEPAECTTVEGDHDGRLTRELVRRCEPVEPWELSVVRCDDEGRREGGDAFRAGAAQDVEQTEHGTQRVAVRADVARERDVGSIPDRADGAIERPVDFRRARLRHPSSCRWSSRMMSSTRCPVVMAGSSRNDNRGRYLSRTC